MVRDDRKSREREAYKLFEYFIEAAKEGNSYKANRTAARLAQLEPKFQRAFFQYLTGAIRAMNDKWLMTQAESI